MQFKDRFQKLLESKKLKPYSIAMEVGLDPAMLWNIAHGKRKPSPKALEAISTSEQLDLSVEKIEAWLALDEFSPAAIREACRILDEEEKEES